MPAGAQGIGTISPESFVRSSLESAFSWRRVALSAGRVRSQRVISVARTRTFVRKKPSAVA